MPSDSRLISIIIPVFNGERFLAAAIKSVLAQTHRPIEIIVVDDGSTDKTNKILEKFSEHIRYIYQDNKGPSAARNTGIDVSKGDLIAFIDADDLWPRDKLAIQLRLLYESEQTEIITGRLCYAVPKHLGKYSFAFKRLSRPYLGFSLGASLIRRSAFDVVGLLEPRMKHYEDIDWFLRARDAGLSIVTHEDVVLYYILHGDNMSRNALKEGNQFLLHALKESINRRDNRKKGL